MQTEFFLAFGRGIIHKIFDLHAIYTHILKKDQGLKTLVTFSFRETLVRPFYFPSFIDRIRIN